MANTTIRDHVCGSFMSDRSVLTLDIPRSLCLCGVVVQLRMATGTADYDNAEILKTTLLEPQHDITPIEYVNESILRCTAPNFTDVLHMVLVGT